MKLSLRSIIATALVAVANPFYAQARPDPIDPCFSFSNKLEARYGASAEKTGTIWNTEVYYRHVPEEAATMGRLPFDVLGDENSVLVGINTFGHMYVVTKKWRFDGEGGYLPPGVARHNSLDLGLLVKIDDPSGQVRGQIDQALDEEYRPTGLTCVSEACRLLTLKGEVSFPEQDLNLFFPTTFLKNVVKKGFVGSEKKPLKHSLLLFGYNNIESFVRALPGQRLSQRYPESQMISAFLGLFFAPVDSVVKEPLILKLIANGINRF